MNQRARAQRFYSRIREAGDKDCIAEIIDPAFVFRGSLGDEKRGHAGFEACVDAVRRALSDYRCEILDAVEQDDRLFARMRFSGVHNGEFMGYAPSGAVVAGRRIVSLRQRQDRGAVGARRRSRPASATCGQCRMTTADCAGP